MKFSERILGWLAPSRSRWELRSNARMAVPAASVFGLSWAPLLALCLGGALVISPLSQPLSNFLNDLAMRSFAQEASYDDVVVIDIDDASLRELRPRLGGWPYSRDTFAVLLTFLRELGANQIVLNLVLSEPRDGDVALARTLGERSDVVLAAVGQDRQLEQDFTVDPLQRKIAIPAEPNMPATHWGNIVLPNRVLLAAQARSGGIGSIGVVSTRLDQDGMLRRLPLLHEADGMVYPSMLLAPRLLAGSSSVDRLQRGRGFLALGQWRWPINAAGEVKLVLPRNHDAVKRLAFSTVMSAALGLTDKGELGASLAGRTIFVGSSAFLGDDVMTPLGRVSGTAVLACAHAALQRGLVLAPQANWLAWAFCGLALLPSIFLWLRRRPALGSDALASAAALVLLLAIGLAVLVRARIDVDLLMPITVLVSGFFIAAWLQLHWFGRANRQLRIERAVAEAENEAKTEFLANVSHEIRTPMNALLGVADLLQRTPLNAEQQRYVSVFQRSGQTLFELINDLLDLSKIEAGQLELEPASFSLKHLLVDEYELFKPKAGSKGLELVWLIGDDLPDTVLGDRRRLTQVLSNLLGNAIKFTATGRVSLEVQQTHAGINFEISDTGIGIDDDHHDRIFKPFVQADASMTRNYGGTGLGLSIAGGLVRQMGGQITLRSKTSVGSTFSFCIPLPPTTAVAAEPVVTSPSQIAEAPPPQVQVQQQPNQRAGQAADAVVPARKAFRILLTEDNEINVLLVEAMLRDVDCVVEVASDGESALEKFQAGSYDLILMDVQMPGIDGHQTTRAIRRIEAAEHRSPVVVIALTAHAFDRDIQRSLDAGCNDHLTKPVSRDSLLAAIRRFRGADIGGDEGAGAS